MVSLVPSETYNLARLGVLDRVVGRTDYCIEPADGVVAIPTVGGTKDFDIDKVMALEPDLIFANQEENSRPALLELARQRYRVFVSFPKTVSDAIAHLARMARILGVERDPEVVDLIRRGSEILRAPRAKSAVRTFVPIWMKPLMTFSSQTYADDVLSWAGFDNVFADRERKYPLKADLGYAEPLAAEEIEGRDTRYPRITLDELVSRAPDALLLPDEPHEFTANDAEVFAGLGLPASSRGAIRHVDGKDLFWPGARTVEGLPRLRELARALV